MAYQTKVETEKNYLVFIIEGEYLYKITGTLLDSVLSACEEHPSPKVLIDLRKLEGNPTTQERFNFASLFAINTMPTARRESIPWWNPGKSGKQWP